MRCRTGPTTQKGNKPQKVRRESTGLWRRSDPQVEQTPGPRSTKKEVQRDRFTLAVVTQEVGVGVRSFAGMPGRSGRTRSEKPRVIGCRGGKQGGGGVGLILLRCPFVLGRGGESGPKAPAQGSLALGGIQGRNPLVNRLDVQGAHQVPVKVQTVLANIGREGVAAQATTVRRPVISASGKPG